MGFLSYSVSSYSQHDLLGVVNGGLCGDFYSGIFIVWGGQLIISFLLFWLIVVVTITWQYYSRS